VSGPLAGLTVLDFTRVFSGPYATLLLADLGARVIKVEHPAHGDDSRAFGPFIAGTSGYFETLNRGKESIAVDDRSAAGRAVLRRLAGRVDVLVENFRPGRMARLGLGYPDAAPLNPGLVYVSLSGFGQTGPLSAHGCYDIVAQGYGGLMGLTGTPEQPVKTGPAVADAISGLTAAVGLLAALWRRERSGQGAHIDVGMVDALFAVLENTLAGYDITGIVPPRAGNADAVLAPFGSFRAADGWLVIGVGNDRLWRALAARIDPALADDPCFATNDDRVRHADRLREVLDAWCAVQPVDALLTELHAAGVPAGPIRDIAELACDPHLEARGMLARVALSDGTLLRVPGSPIHVDGLTPAMRRGPRLGEHTRAVLSEMADIDDGDYRRLTAADVVRDAG